MPLSYRRRLAAVLVFAAAWLIAPFASAQSLPVKITVSGKVATVQVGLLGQPVADLLLSFDDASGLSAASLGVRAELIAPTNPALLARLPDPSLTSIPTALPLLITIEPPLQGGLEFRRQARIELHTHALSYSAGSPYRLFKAPLGGAFRDITTAVSPGSVRTRGHTGGFSQFLVLIDLRPSSQVIAEKLTVLRAEAALLASSERVWVDAQLDTIEGALASQAYADAQASIDALSADIAAAAGGRIAERWRASRDLHNSAGELLSGLDSLRFSIGFLHDYGL